MFQNPLIGCACGHSTRHYTTIGYCSVFTRLQNMSLVSPNLSRIHCLRLNIRLLAAAPQLSRLRTSSRNFSTEPGTFIETARIFLLAYALLVSDASPAIFICNRPGTHSPATLIRFKVYLVTQAQIVGGAAETDHKTLGFEIPLHHLKALPRVQIQSVYLWNAVHKTCRPPVLSNSAQIDRYFFQSFLFTRSEECVSCAPSLMTAL